MPKMAEIVNLRQARKRKSRAEKETLASENRIKFGRTKAEKSSLDTRSAKEKHELDGKKLDD